MRELASEEALWEAGCKEKWSNCRPRDQYPTWAELYRCPSISQKEENPE